MKLETPWQKARKLKWVEQEESLGALPLGRKTPGSGRIWRWRRDGQIHEYLIEARTTEKNSYSVDKKEFLDIRKEALRTPPGLLPGMQVTIQDLDLMVISLVDFKDMYTRIVELEARFDPPDTP